MATIILVSIGFIGSILGCILGIKILVDDCPLSEKWPFAMAEFLFAGVLFATALSLLGVK